MKRINKGLRPIWNDLFVAERLDLLRIGRAKGIVYRISPHRGRFRFLVQNMANGSELGRSTRLRLVW